MKFWDKIIPRKNKKEPDPLAHIPWDIPDKDKFKLPQDNAICKTKGHLHLVRIQKKEVWWSGTAHSMSCVRCGWKDDCVWT